MSLLPLGGPPCRAVPGGRRPDEGSNTGRRRLNNSTPHPSPLPQGERGQNPLKTWPSTTLDPFGNASPVIQRTGRRCPTLKLDTRTSDEDNHDPSHPSMHAAERDAWPQPVFHGLHGDKTPALRTEELLQAALRLGLRELMRRASRLRLQRLPRQWLRWLRRLQRALLAVRLPGRLPASAVDGDS
jgi:hypothetical protein